MNPLSFSQATGSNSLGMSPPSKLQTAIDGIVNRKDCNRQYSCNTFYFQFYQNYGFYQCYLTSNVVLTLNVLTSNLKFTKSNTAGQVATWSQCVGKQVMGCCRLVGGTFSIWFPYRAVPMGGGVPDRAAWGKSNSPWPLCSDSWLGEINSGCLLLVVTLMRLNHQALPPLRVDSSASHGGRGCLMRSTGSCNICHTPGQACSAPFKGGWWLSPHSGPPSHTRGSESCHWSGKGHLGHVCPPVP